jgi:hypothetical protein
VLFLLSSVLSQAYHTLDTEYVYKLFAFETVNSCLDYLAEIPVVFSDAGRTVIDLKNSRAAILEVKINVR